LPGVFFGSAIPNIWIGYKIAPDLGAAELATLSLSLSLGGMWALDTFLRAVAEAVL
jgi:hypothetical protein